jgi:hypothetical protein
LPLPFGKAAKDEHVPRRRYVRCRGSVSRVQCPNREWSEHVNDHF